MTKEILAEYYWGYKENTRYFDKNLLTAQLIDGTILMHNIFEIKFRKEVKKLQVQTKIAKYLADNGIKKCHVAQKAGIRDYRFSMIIHNRTPMRADEFERICTALNVSPEMFMTCKTE